MAPCSTRAAAMFQYVVTMRYGALVLPRYTVRISSALAGANCSRNQARAFRMTASRRRSYSLSSRSALSYLVVTGGSSDGRLFGSYADCFPAATQARHVSSAGPTLSCCRWRTSGMRSSSGSTASLSSQRSSESSADPRPSSAKRLASRSIRARTPNFWAKRRSSAGEAARSLRSTNWVLTRRSAKKRSAARVSAHFRTPKICTSILAAGREPHGAQLDEPLQRGFERPHREPGSRGELLERALPVREPHHGCDAGVALRHGHAPVRRARDQQLGRPLGSARHLSPGLEQPGQHRWKIVLQVQE